MKRFTALIVVVTKMKCNRPPVNISGMREKAVCLLSELSKRRQFCVIALLIQLLYSNTNTKVDSPNYSMVHRCLVIAITALSAFSHFSYIYICWVH